MRLMAVLGIDLPVPVLLLGLIIGLTYGLLSVGLVLVYRSNRIINFAHGEIGAFSAAVLGVAVVRWHVPYWVAFVLALVLAAATASLVEVGVIRRLRRAPKLMSVVATLGFSQFLLLFGLIVNSQAGTASLYPQPSWLPKFDVGALRVTPAYTGMIVLTPVVVAALTLFLRYSRLGISMRGAAANPERARMSGVYASRMSTLSWAIAGAVSAMTAILLLPTRGFASSEAFGPGLLLRALCAAVIARMASLPIAFAAGITIGVVEQGLLWNRPSGGLIEAILFGIILVALALRSREATRVEEKGSWAAVVAWPPLPEAFSGVWAIRNLGRILAAAALVTAVVVPALSSNRTSSILVSVMSFALIGLSVGIVTGLSGQLSLGQFALAGIGATASYRLAETTGSFPLAFVGGALVAALVSIVIGIPALRIRGLMLAVTTLGFALVARAWLFQQPWMLGSGVDPGRPRLVGFEFDTAKDYYFFTLVFLVAALWLARNLRSSGFGRSLVALRDNQDGARAFTVPATLRKLQAFAVAGFLAGLGGAVYGHGLSVIGPETFPSAASINIVAITVIGGIGILAGPLLGAFYIIGIPSFVPLDSAGLAATSLGWLFLILYFPGGLAQLIEPLRDRSVDWIARRSGLDPAKVRSESKALTDTSEFRPAATALDASPAQVAPGTGGVLLTVDAVRKEYGGLTAVADVSFEVREGETLGLIGPNGAGKTTLFEVVSGFTRPDGGAIVFAGKDITRLSPEARARMGLIRSFQDAFLFPTMTVLEAVQLADESRHPSRLLACAVGVSEAEREERARDLLDHMGLHAFRNRQIGHLSTGTRRITELACLVALRPRLLLLDEPSSGIAQRETEALGEVLTQLKAHLAATLVVIEHDMPLIMGISDRIIAMEAGRVLADGAPDTVRSDPRVIESYLGGDLRAIERSGHAVPASRAR